MAGKWSASAGPEIPTRLTAKAQTWLLAALVAMGWIVAALLPGEVPRP